MKSKRYSTEEVVIQALEKGLPISVACEKAGISQTLYHRYMNEVNDDTYTPTELVALRQFRARAKKARADSVEADLQVIGDAARQGTTNGNPRQVT